MIILLGTAYIGSDFLIINHEFNIKSTGVTQVPPQPCLSPMLSPTILCSIGFFLLIGDLGPMPWQCLTSSMEHKVLQIAPLK